MTASPATKIREANDALLVRGDLDAVAQYFAPDYLVHLTDQAMARGHQGVREFVTRVRRAFGDLRVEVQILMAGRTRVAWHRTMTATHRRPFQGFPATGRTIIWRDQVVSEFRAGVIAEEWAVSDLAERLLRARKR